MKHSPIEIISYVIIVLFIIGIFYFAYTYKESIENARLEKGEIVEGEKDIKKEIIKEADNIQDELIEIEELIG